MEIKTITCHDVYNHGASLQALALVTYLNQLGHNAQIINYKPWYANTYSHIWKVNNPKYNRLLLKQMYLLAKLPKRIKDLLIVAPPFNRFTKTNLPLTKHYATYLRLTEDVPIADAYIAGSDQIWNTHRENGRDPAFYLSFVPKEKIKISYAASFAQDTVDEEYRDFLSKSVRRLDAISVREIGAIEILKSLGIERGVAVYDPVFLLSKERWNSFLASSECAKVSGYRNLKRYFKAPYLLVYDADGSDTLQAVAKEIAKRKGLKIYAVGNIKYSCADKSFWHASPFDFVELVANANYIISNSFHATAFSLIYEKEFCVSYRKDASNSRMSGLLGELGLADRMVSEVQESLFKKIDYTLVNKVIAKRVQESELFIKSALANNSK